MLQVAETYGMPLGIIQATNSAFWKGYSKVLGVFPYVGTPFRRAVEGAQEGTRQFLKTIRWICTFTNYGIFRWRHFKISSKEYEDTMRISNALYESFYKYAEKLKGKKVIKLDTLKR